MTQEKTKKGQAESEIILLWMCQGAIHKKGQVVDLIQSATVSVESKIKDAGLLKLSNLWVFPTAKELYPRGKEEFICLRFNKQNEVNAVFIEPFQDDWMWSHDQNRCAREPSCFLHLKVQRKSLLFPWAEMEVHLGKKNSSPKLQDASNRHLQMFPQLLWGPPALLQNTLKHGEIRFSFRNRCLNLRNLWPIYLTWDVKEYLNVKSIFLLKSGRKYKTHSIILCFSLNMFFFLLYNLINYYQKQIF